MIFTHKTQRISNLDETIVYGRPMSDTTVTLRVST